MIKEIIFVFLKLGLFAFGGPAAHIALMEEEFVDKRKWLSKQEFLDLLGFTNLIPGPNSTEMAIMIGWKRAGVLGLFAAGIFLPSFILILILGPVFNRLKEIDWISLLLKGVATGSLALMAIVVVNLGIETLINWQTVVLFIFSLLGIVKFKKSPMLFIGLGLILGLVTSFI